MQGMVFNQSNLFTRLANVREGLLGLEQLAVMLLSMNWIWGVIPMETRGGMGYSELLWTRQGGMSHHIYLSFSLKFLQTKVFNTKCSVGKKGEHPLHILKCKYNKAQKEYCV